MNTRERGSWGEQQALSFLYKKGYTLIKKNYRSRFGEIDLIVKNDEFIVFVEVKVRKNTDFAHAREFVGNKKQNKIQTTANLYLSKREPNLQPRFDVIEIYTNSEILKPQINHIENAF